MAGRRIRVRIPREVFEKLNLRPGDEVVIMYEGDTVKLTVRGRDVTVTLPKDAVEEEE